MLRYVHEFRTDESGAVTVDWVVLTAAIVGFVIVIMTAVISSVDNVAGDVGTDMAARLGTNYDN